MKLYHTTSPDRVEKILKEGLRVNSDYNKTRAAERYMRKAYDGIVPIFLSLKRGRYINGIILEVDASGFDLVADIPGLLDHDGYLMNDSSGIYWEEMNFGDLNQDPEKQDLIYELGGDDGEVTFDVLNDPNSKETQLAIQITETCAVKQDIPPDRIKVVGTIKEVVSTKKKSSKDFLNKVKAKSPNLYRKLIDKAEWFLRKDIADKTPKDLKTTFASELARDPEMNPTVSPDTYGIKKAIDAVADEKEDATSAKRLFGNTLDQVFKEELYGDTVNEKTITLEAAMNDNPMPDLISGKLVHEIIFYLDNINDDSSPENITLTYSKIVDKEEKQHWLNNKLKLEGPPDRKIVNKYSRLNIKTPIVVDLYRDHCVDGRHRLAASLISGKPLPVVYIDINDATDSISEANKYHMSKKPVDSVDDVSSQPSSSPKPTGFWYSCEHEWHDWVRLEMPNWEGDNYYDVQIDYSNVLVIDTYEKLLDFDAQYKNKEFGINWQLVAQEYSGIEICPYQYKVRYKLMWYYGWDIASGCIWKRDAIKAIKKADKPTNK